MRLVKSGITALFFLIVFSGCSESVAGSDFARDNAEVASVVRDIRENGPQELRQLSPSIIESTVRTFVSGRSSGVISAEQLARMGGVRGATESSLMGQLKFLGAR